MGTYFEHSDARLWKRALRPYSVPFVYEAVEFDEAMDIIHQTKRFGICPLLETVEDMLAELGNPEQRFGCVQIVGTNGKTSTARYLAHILAGEGLRVALYTSPELVSYTERMEIGGSPIEPKAFAWAISAAGEAGRRVNERRVAAGERPYDVTEFDLLTVAAFIAFAWANVEVCVLECGMGGRWDATTASTSIDEIVVTGIGLDHIHVLGDTLEAIAAEKAATIKEGHLCVLGVGTATPDSVEDVFLDRCAEKSVEPVLLRPTRLADAEGEMCPGTPRVHEGLPAASYEIAERPRHVGDGLVVDVRTPRTTYAGVRAPKPCYQAANISCAITAAELYLGRELDREMLLRQVWECPTPGRFDVVREEPVGLIDAAHNPQSVETFLTAVRNVTPEVGERPDLLCAVLADKDVPGIVDLLADEFPGVWVCQTNSSRALAATELADIYRSRGVEPKGVFSTVSEALEALADVPFVACGSITLAGEVAGILRG